MLRFFAKRWAKLRYVFKEEFEAAISDLNAKAALSQAQDKRDLIAQVTKEADAIEQRIAELVKKEESGYWLCEDGHETTIHDTAQDGSDLCSACRLKPAKFVKRDQMTGQEQYESDKERKDAEKMLQSKRDYAEKVLPAEIQKHVETANHFQRQGAQAREFADRLRRL